METQTRVLVNAHAMIRDGLKLILEETRRFCVVGEAGSGEEAVRLAREKEPDVVLVDTAICPMGVIRVVRALTPLRPKISVLVLTDPEDSESLGPIIEAGAMGSISKNRPAADLVMVVDLVAAGRMCFPQRASRLIRRRTETNGSRLEARLVKLNEKERTILSLVARGLTSKEIGRRIPMTAKSVDNARSRVRNKLGLKTRADLVAFAIKAGLLHQNGEP